LMYTHRKRDCCVHMVLSHWPFDPLLQLWRLMFSSRTC
jgi:hypothetical protein